MKSEGSWFLSPFNGALGEQCWVLEPISSACMCIARKDFFGWKTRVVSESGTVADCKVIALQLTQGMLPTHGIITGWFHHPYGRHKSTIYIIFAGKRPRICVFPPHQSVVWPQSLLQEMHSSCALSPTECNLTSHRRLIFQRLFVDLCPPLDCTWAT